MFENIAGIFKKAGHVLVQRQDQLMAAAVPLISSVIIACALTPVPFIKGAALLSGVATSALAAWIYERTECYMSAVHVSTVSCVGLIASGIIFHHSQAMSYHMSYLKELSNLDVASKTLCQEPVATEIWKNGKRFEAEVIMPSQDKKLRAPRLVVGYLYEGLYARHGNERRQFAVELPSTNPQGTCTPLDQVKL